MKKKSIFIANFFNFNIFFKKKLILVVEQSPKEKSSATIMYSTLDTKMNSTLDTNQSIFSLKFIFEIYKLKNKQQL